MLTTLPAALQQGRAEPLGALARDGGVNFAVFSQHAQRMELCIFDSEGTRELRRFDLHGPHDDIWHGFLPNLGPGLVYGLRAHGPHAPHEGHRFNPHKLLLDPCAREIQGRFHWHEEHYGYILGHPDGVRSLDTRDNSAQALKARVPPPPQPAKGWFNAPRHADRDVVIYEVHVKGFSQQLPGLPQALRGTYAALAHPVSIAHFKRLGVTTLELLPVHYHLDEPFLAARGLSNYWGYNTLGFFCPDPGLAQRGADPSAVNEEFRAMVAALHEQGLEVVLDVVFNHTPEGGELGPTLSFRGLDHKSYYLLGSDDPSRCDNYSGCGNTVQVAQPRVMQFVLDALRYWVQEMGVDGFRFDLAPVLGRRRQGFDRYAAFFAAVAQDPVLARARLIAESWDCGPDGYQVGRFPGRWTEWNDKFRDTMRRYWLPTSTAPPAQVSGFAPLGIGGVDAYLAANPTGPGNLPSHNPRVSRGEFARRFTASSDLFHHGQRRPTSSVNFIAAHDGFTLADFTSYSHKHNLANGEDNRDGRSDELCANMGDEGPSSDPAVLALRARVRRALLATLLLAQGTPMLNAGDEFANSQGGNNNAWNQDNPTGWLGWDEADEGLIDFVARVLALRRAHPALRHDRWFVGPEHGPGERCLRWVTPQGRDMQHSDWHDLSQAAFAGLLDASTAATVEAPPGSSHSPHAQATAKRQILIAFNPTPARVDFALPAGLWTIELDSAERLPQGSVVQKTVAVPANALVVLSSPGVLDT